MQEIGLRPRLRLRASFYDLVKSQNIRNTTTTTTLVQEAELAAQSIPLPPSPTTTRKPILTPKTQDRPVQAAVELKEAVKMVPVSLKCEMQ